MIWKMDSIAFIVTMFLLALYFFIYIGFKKRIYNCSYGMKEEKSNFFSRLQEQLEKIEFIKIHSMDSFFSNRLVASYQKLYPIFYFILKNIFTAKFYHSNSPCYFIEPFLSSAPTSLLHSILLKNKSYFYKQHTHHNILEKMNNLYILDPLQHHRKAILQIYL